MEASEEPVVIVGRIQQPKLKGNEEKERTDVEEEQLVEIVRSV
jgi:hypothetical protein